MKDLRLALLQCESLPGEISANLQRLDDACRDAAAAGADLLVTPEMFLTGYNIGRQAAASLADHAHGARVKSVADLARRHGIAVVFGHPERDRSGAVLNAAVCVDARGLLIGGYHKTHLFGDLDRDMFSAGPGDEPLFDIEGWKIGMLICFDVEFPENARRLALQGADLIVVPTANMEGFDFVAQHLVPTRAYENQVFVAYANFCGHEDDLVYGGLSCVAAPNGNVLVNADRTPTLMCVDLKRDELTAARKRLGHLEICRSLGE